MSQGIVAEEIDREALRSPSEFAADSFAAAPRPDSSRDDERSKPHFYSVAGKAAVILLLLTFFAQDFRACFVPQHRYVVDFYQEWLAGRNISRGYAVYQPLMESLRAHKDVVPIRLDDRSDGLGTLVDINVHPPTAIALGWPVSWLDYDAAFVTWNVLSAICLATSLMLVVRELNFRIGALDWVLFASLLLICEPLRQQFRQGQWSALIALLVTFSWWASRRNHSFWAGMAIGLAASIKLSPAFVLVYFVCRRDFRALAAAAATGAVVVAASLPICGAEAYQQYLTDVMPNTPKWAGTIGNASLVSFWAKLFAPTGYFGPGIALWDQAWLSTALSLATIAILLGAIAALCRRSVTLKTHDLTYSLTIVGMLLVSPVTWDHYFLLLFVPVAVLASRQTGSLNRFVFGATLAALWLPMVSIAVLFQRKPLDLQDIPPSATLTLFAIPTYALVVLCWQIWRTAVYESASELAHGLRAGLHHS